MDTESTPSRNRALALPLRARLRFGDEATQSLVRTGHGPRAGHWRVPLTGYGPGRRPRLPPKLAFGHASEGSGVGRRSGWRSSVARLSAPSRLPSLSLPSKRGSGQPSLVALFALHILCSTPAAPGFATPAGPGPAPPTGTPARRTGGTETQPTTHPLGSSFQWNLSLVVFVLVSARGPRRWPARPRRMQHAGHDPRAGRLPTPFTTPAASNSPTPPRFPPVDRSPVTQSLPAAMALRRQLFLLALLPAVAVAFMGKYVRPSAGLPPPMRTMRLHTNSPHASPHTPLPPCRPCAPLETRWVSASVRPTGCSIIQKGWRHHRAFEIRGVAGTDTPPSHPYHTTPHHSTHFSQHADAAGHDGLQLPHALGAQQQQQHGRRPRARQPQEH